MSNHTTPQTADRTGRLEDREESIAPTIHGGGKAIDNSRIPLDTTTSPPPHNDHGATALTIPTPNEL
jgi:hypothetical protein